MRCELCGRGFSDGQKLVPVMRYVTNEKRGDFVGGQPVGYIHLHHLKIVMTDDSGKKGAQ